MSTPSTTTDGWATTDLWTMVGGIAAALAVVGPVVVWAFRAARQRQAQFRPRVGRGGPVRGRVASADQPAGRLDGPLGGGRLWNVPSPVRSFTGRDPQLAALRAQLTAERSAALVPATALHGIGGVGKTQLALAYAQQYREDYWLGWWVPAETQVTTTSALAQLGGELGLPTDLPPHELAARLAALLADRGGWLLIFDNATGPATLGPFLPGTCWSPPATPPGRGSPTPSPLTSSAWRRPPGCCGGAAAILTSRLRVRWPGRLAGCRWRWSRPAPTPASTI
jgi:hypothetical protein